MVKLTKIYTRGGDEGKTSLVSGVRIYKHDPRMDAIGAVDEANAIIGMVRLSTKAGIDEMLSRIQNDLFDLGADLATPASDKDGDDFAPSDMVLRVTQAQVDRLEHEIDAMNERLQPLTSFILPGGSQASAHLHLARTVVRRAERAMTALAQVEAVNPAALRYANRLSDHLFVLARVMNDNGAADILWVPGKNR